MENEIFLTRLGYEKLKDELDFLKSKKRREISEQIKEARLKGDLKENAEYDAAREAQAHLEKRIIELETKLSCCRIIENENIPSDKAYIGATVFIRDIDLEKDEVYTLVSQDEADYNQNKISIVSPIGKAILGKKIGELIEIDVPAGKLRYKILDIKRQ